MLETTPHRTSAPPGCAWCGALLEREPGSPPGRTPCARCGAATTDPWPSDEELDRAYGGWYRPPSGRFSGPGDALLRRTRARLAARLARMAPPGPVLDVGAGDGALLDALGRRGRSATGLERRSERADVLEVAIEELGGAYAAIVFWHSLEHLRAPGAALAAAAGLLSPGGVLILATPNAGSLQARAFGDRWFGLDIPRHLVHVPAAVLLETLDELGLRVERVSHLRGGQVVFGWLHGLVGSLPGRPDLYDAIRRPAARARRGAPLGRAATLGAALALLPVALALALAEAGLGRGGTVYVEARNR